MICCYLGNIQSKGYLPYAYQCIKGQEERQSDVNDRNFGMMLKIESNRSNRCEGNESYQRLINFHDSASQVVDVDLAS